MRIPDATEMRWVLQLLPYDWVVVARTHELTQPWWLWVHPTVLEWGIAAKRMVVRTPQALRLADRSDVHVVLLAHVRAIAGWSVYSWARNEYPQVSRQVELLRHLPVF